MLALKNLNLLLIVFLCCFIHSQCRSVSVSQIGDVRIEMTDTKWLCDKIECPSNADRCYVSKINDPKDPSVLVRTNICFSKDNQSLAQSVTTSQIDPNNKIKVEINSNRNGGISTVNYNNLNGSGDFDAEKFNVELNDLHKNIQDQLSNINKELAENLSHIGDSFDNMFG